MNTLIADDHALVLEGLKFVLQKLGSDVNVQKRSDLPTAMKLAAELAADGVALDLAILDFCMPGMNGSAGVETFCTRFSDTPVIVLSGHHRRQRPEPSPWYPPARRGQSHRRSRSPSGRRCRSR